MLLQDKTARRHTSAARCEGLRHCNSERKRDAALARQSAPDPRRWWALAPGLNNTAFQIGGALGVAIISTVAVSRSDDYLAASEGAQPLVVLTEGFESAFVACVVLAGVGAALALVLLGRAHQAREQLVPAPAPPGD